MSHLRPKNKNCGGEDRQVKRANAKPVIKWRTPLHWASLNGQLDDVQSLVEAGADPHATDHRQQTPLHLAAFNGHLHVVKFLAEKTDANLTAIDHRSLTPFNLSHKNGHWDVMKYLGEEAFNRRNKQALVYGEPDSAPNNTEGQVPLTILSPREMNLPENNSQNSLASTPVPVPDNSNISLRGADRQTVDLEAEDSDSRTPLHWAALYGHLEVVQCLVEAGGNPRSIDREQRTPLHLASSNGHLRVAQFLVEKTNADPDAKDCTGQTPMSLANSNGHPHIAQFLETFRVDSKVDSTRNSMPQGVLPRNSSRNVSTSIPVLGNNNTPLEIVQRFFDGGTNFETLNRLWVAKISELRQNRGLVKHLSKTVAMVHYVDSIDDPAFSAVVAMGLIVAAVSEGPFRNRLIKHGKTPRLVGIDPELMLHEQIDVMIRHLDRRDCQFEEDPVIDLVATYRELLNLCQRLDLSQYEVPENFFVLTTTSFDFREMGASFGFEWVEKESPMLGITVMYKASGFDCPRLVHWDVTGGQGIASPSTVPLGRIYGPYYCATRLIGFNPERMIDALDNPNKIDFVEF
jgi:ankyrin repeat protein